MSSGISSDTVKHLEFLQAVITRLNQTAFLIKGWAMTLTAGVIGLAASQGDLRICGAGLVPVSSFWLLDSYFLRQERMYRRLYDAARRPDGSVENFSMDATPYKTQVPFRGAAFSPLLLLFYATSVVTLLALTILAFTL
ncbi:hypothetical protein E5083_13165 [Streptomyces bauhiniae]|uniref:Uncharacterized protein n=1 Tax=Streptomyces bauhiniae TaxID=2340725 RepID=A0A4Z1D8J2_9ACTN|nr:hypothetical protein E5083_13165 [Streptomyces bauhiniae]